MHFPFPRLLAISLLVAPVVAPAQTNLNLYGVLDAFVGSVKTTQPGGGGGTATVVDSGGLQTSYWGIHGSEDLGGGLKAIFTLEAFLRNDTGAAGRFDGDAFFARDANAGFEGGFGRVTLGRNTTPYFISTLSFNPLADSFVVGPMIAHTFGGASFGGASFGGAIEGDTAMSNSIRFTSKTVSGLSADFLWSAGNERDAPPDRHRNRAFDGALFYGSGPFAASFAWRNINLSGSIAPEDGRKQRFLLLGASYDWKLVKLFGQYQDGKESFAVAPDIDRRTWQIGASVPVSAGNVLAAWAHTKTDDVSPTTSDKRSTWALGYDYNLSKRTDVYAMYYHDKFDDPEGPKRQVLGLGVRHRF
ncbi:MAG: porin [Gammaproteobacteria bacterium]